MPDVPSISGAGDVVEWFGRWPSFHDAEILELYLRRSGSSWLKIYNWNMLAEVDAKGFFVQDKHAVVTFTLESITDLQLADFSGQNVITRLVLTAEKDGFKLVLAPCYGLAGSVCAKKISVSVAPGKPTCS